MSKDRKERAKAFRESIIWSDRKRTSFLGLPWSFTKYILTKDRFIIKTGFLNVKEDEIRLYRIMDISLKRSLGQRLFGLGTVHVCSADKTLGDFDIKNVKHPSDFKELLSSAVENERVAKRVFNREDLTHDHDDDDMSPDFHDHDSDHDVNDDEV
ncbi:MAG: PH domain-containing protein [Clostridia bacterium]|nr:PH domain-containing protein [Clostridia bacterium]